MTDFVSIRFSLRKKYIAFYFIRFLDKNKK